MEVIIIAYDAARNIAFPYDYGLLLGRRACVGGTMANVSVVSISAGPRGWPTGVADGGGSQ